MAKSRNGGGNTPPQLGNVIPHFIKTYRFSMSSGTVSINSDQVIAACGGIASTTTGLRPFVGAIKVLSVKMWAPSASNALASCSCSWEGGPFGITKTITDSSISVTTPAKVFTKPPRGSSSDFWQNTNANPLFTLSTNVGSTIVDVKLSCILNDNTVVYSFSPITIVGATVGNLYFLGLDGLGAATSKFIPLGVPTGV
jgi:hypothetical protein